MPNLSVLTTGELHATERACEYLMQLHDRHQAIDRDLYVKLSTLFADVCAQLEDHAAAERRHRVAQAARQASVIPS
jgi:hypothetical protein